MYAEKKARVQREALLLGRATYLTDGEARVTSETVDRGVDRVWQLWMNEVAEVVMKRLKT